MIGLGGGKVNNTLEKLLLNPHIDNMSTKSNDNQLFLFLAQLPEFLDKHNDKLTVLCVRHGLMKKSEKLCLELVNSNRKFNVFCDEFLQVLRKGHPGKGPLDLDEQEAMSAAMVAIDGVFTSFGMKTSKDYDLSDLPASEKTVVEEYLGVLHGEIDDPDIFIKHLFPSAENLTILAKVFDPRVLGLDFDAAAFITPQAGLKPLILQLTKAARPTDQNVDRLANLLSDEDAHNEKEVQAIVKDLITKSLKHSYEFSETLQVATDRVQAIMKEK